MKYLVSVTVGPKESNVNDASISTFQCVQKYHVPIFLYIPFSYNILALCVTKK